ncbi:MAG: hypothetical protein WCH98_09250 [Verrucomicrobiota bacterium]
MRNCIRIIISAAIALAVTSCERPAKVVPKKQTEADKTRAIAKAKHPDANDLMGDGFTDIFKRKGFTIEMQDRIAHNPKQLYWVSSDDFDIYRTRKCAVVFLSLPGGDWLSLQCPEEELSSILEMNKAFPKVKLLLFFSLSSASPLHVEMKADYDVGSAEDDEPPLSSIVTEDINAQLFKGDLVDTAMLEFTRKKDRDITALFPK